MRYVIIGNSAAAIGAVEGESEMWIKTGTSLLFQTSPITPIRVRLSAICCAARPPRKK